MNSIVKIIPNVKKYKSYLDDVKSGISPIMLSGLTDNGKVHLAFSTGFYSDKPVCIITYNEMQAKKLIKDLEYFSEEIVYFPKREIFAYDYLAESKEEAFERMDAIRKIQNGEAKVIVTTIEALMQPMVSKEVLFKNVKKFKIGDEINLDEIKESLVALGYERYDLIEGRGQFSIRGGIIDIASGNNTGIRIELWGDEIDSIREFNISTQRSVNMLKEVTIEPSFEFILEYDLETVCKKIKKHGYSSSYEDILNEDIEQILAGDYINKIDKYLTCFYKEQVSFLDYLDKNTIIFLDENQKIKTRCENILKDNKEIIKSVVERNKIAPQILQNLFKYPQLGDKIGDRQTIYLEKKDIGFVDIKSMHAKRNGYSFSYREVNFFRSSMDLLFKELQEASIKGKQTVILGGNKENASRLNKILEDHEIKTVFKEKLEDIDIAPGVVYVTTGAMSTGFESFDLNLLVIDCNQIIQTKPKRKKSSSAFKNGETVVFSDLKIGDYVVHRVHGIGVYIGVNTIKADGITKDYIKIKYKDDDILYIPTDSLDSIRKFIGSGNSSPKINRLGSKDWEKTKNRVKNNLREVARELIELYAIRQKVRGYAFSKDSNWQKEFEDNFEYIETDDQIRCIEELKKDMENQKPMDRLLCGDVGYGKTEVAIRGAFKACMDQKQVAYLVPTTVLANQQYESFKNRMKDFPIRVELLNRFRTKKEQDEIVKKLELGEIDIIIGTHRLLSKDVKFKNLGFLIIDEEHRFGVKDKEKIKALKNNVDVLAMTATPIPRTLHMSLVGIRDMSVIYDPPQNRKPVQTYVLEQDDEVIREAITKELERDGQVFYLYNKVETILKKANEIQRLVPEAKIGIAHGKMTGHELEDIMQDFIDGKINVLVCTTILESGIDIPNANSIIVEDSDRLGLAQLYQIRGRVGRSDRQAYAYIMYKKNKLLSEVADKRLKAIKEFTEFGSGFKIAMRDLEIRGAGSILGEMQHGHMEQVGYDMYCRLLDEVVREMKGIEVEEEKDVQIDINVSSFIPDEFIEDSNQKIEIYQNIALCKNEDDIKDVVDEIIDRYGNIPQEIENLLDIARIKNIAKEKNIIKIIQKQNSVVFYFDVKFFNFSVVDELIKKFGERIRFSPAANPYVTYKLKGSKDVLNEVKDFLGNL
ncbi:MAG: transcription-repair coupling factor [Clostridia bacterium]|nr:transcription-repair coupling factor [Clostridia bacterium]